MNKMTMEMHSYKHIINKQMKKYSLYIYANWYRIIVGEEYVYGLPCFLGVIDHGMQLPDTEC
jgi:hypothetical protein